MENLSLNADMNIEATARFISKGSDLPLTGAAYKVKLFDKDSFKDDHLGESGLDGNGMATIRFTHQSFSGKGDTDPMPDFYFVLYKNGVEVFHSQVMNDLDMDAIEQFKMGKGEVVDLGTYLVDAGKEE